MIIYIIGILRGYTSVQFDFLRPSKYIVITTFSIEIFLSYSKGIFCMITVTNITKQEKLFTDRLYYDRIMVVVVVLVIKPFIV